MLTYSSWLRLRASGCWMAVVIVSQVSLVAAQQPGRGVVPREVRGVAKSIDTAARSVTISTFEGGTIGADKTFTLAADAEIALGDGTVRRGAYAAGKLEDLRPGNQLSLYLAEGSDTSIASLLATGQQVRGTVKSVDAAQHKFTVSVLSLGREQNMEELTLAVTPQTEIGIDDGRGRRFSIQAGQLKDLVDGVAVVVQLSTDRQSVLSLVAEGPALQGIVKSVANGQITLTLNPTRSNEEPSEKTLDMAADALVLLDDGRGRRLSVVAGQLADVPTGSVVRVRLSGDQKQVVQLQAEGPTQGGRVTAVDAEKRTITLSTFVNRGAQPEEKTWTLAADARILVDNKPGQLNEVKPGENGPFATARLSLDQKSVQSLTVVVNR